MLSSLLFAERYFGLPVCYWFGHLCHYVSKSAEDARVILNNPKCLDKAQLYGDVQYVFKNSILLIPGEFAYKENVILIIFAMCRRAMERSSALSA